MENIPEKQYQEILKSMPILCVDLVIIKSGKYLLIKRINEPAKNLWWTPGGRMQKGESVKNAALRKAKEEIGLKCDFIKTLGIYEGVFNSGPFGFGVHTLSIFCLLTSDSEDVILDKQSSDYKWTFNIEDSPKELRNLIIKGIKHAPEK